MRLPFVLPLVTATLLAPFTSAQEKITDLKPFEKAFRDNVGGEPVVAIVCMTGSPPVTLRGGLDDGERAAGRNSLIPVGGIAHLLLGDALNAKRRGKLDDTALEVGDTKVSWKELIQGSPLLPDYVAWAGTKDQPTLKELIACAETFQATGQQPWNWMGLSDTLALAPELQGKAHPDLSSALRAHLAPYVPGFDPVDARSLTTEARKRVMHRNDNGVEVTRAEPPAARLVVPVKQLANWLQWRHASGATLWSGPRSGRMGEAYGYDDVKRWEMWTRGAVRIRIFAYPDHGATLMLCDTGGDRALVPAFQRVLLGEPNAVSSRMGVMEMLEEAKNTGVEKFGTRPWQLVGSEVAGTLRLDKEHFVFTYDGVERRSAHWSGTADTGFVIDFGDNGDQTTNRVALRFLDATPTRLHAAWVERRSWYHVLPRHLVFAPPQGNGR